MTHVDFDGVLVPLVMRMRACGCWHHLRTGQQYQCAAHNTWRETTLVLKGTAPLITARWRGGVAAD